MSKKRRTRQEKIEAQSRQDFSQVFRVSEIKLPQLEVPEEAKINIHNQVSINHTHVVKDVKSTLFITSILMVLNVIIFFILKLNIVNILGVRF